MIKELPKGKSKDEIANIIDIWNALDVLISNGIMPDVVINFFSTNECVYSEFMINEATFYITNYVGEEPHLEDCIGFEVGDDIENYSLEDLKGML